MNIKCIFKHNFILLEWYKWFNIIGEKYVCQKCNNYAYIVRLESEKINPKIKLSNFHSYCFYRQAKPIKLYDKLSIRVNRINTLNNILCK
jgi:hypothetical protein